MYHQAQQPQQHPYHFLDSAEKPDHEADSRRISEHPEYQRLATLLAHQLGWVAYLNDGTLFIKRFPHEKGKHYPDHGCNFETFSNQEMEEIESLGPLVKLGAGKSVEHTEHWELAGNVQDFTDEAGIEKNVRPKVSEH